MGFAHVTLAWFEQDPEAFAHLESVLRAGCPTLHAFIIDGECRIRGTFAAVGPDRYVLDIALPINYPHSMPSVWESGGRIPREIDRHVFDDGSLCLGAPLALWIQLGGNYSIERVIDGPLRSYLICNSLVEEGEPWPYGDRPHAAGLLEHVGELIGTSDPKPVGRFLIDVGGAGLDDVYLLNGFERKETDYGPTVEILDVPGLRKAIALRLVTEPKPLSPREFRFLRKQMDLTQEVVAERLRVDVQTVARYEKEQTAIPASTDFALRMLFVFHVTPKKLREELIEDVRAFLEEEHLEADSSAKVFEYARNAGWNEHTAVN
jgi:putative transcriptional regulator